MTTPILAAMHPEQMRTTQLRHVIDSSPTVCKVTDPDDWFRADDEGMFQWTARRADLLATCGDCPMLAFCRELTLRQEDANRCYRPDLDDMVRGGLTGYEIRTELQQPATAARIEQALADDEELDTERRTIQAASDKLRTRLLTHRDSRTDGKTNQEIRRAADELTALRTARRERAGWGAAA